MEKGRLIIDGIDVGGSSGSASSISYSNTNSGLEATNAQGAIDELATSVTELNSNMEWKLVEEVTGTTLVTLPISFNEILVIATRSDGNVSVQLNVPYIALFDTTKGFHAGAYGNDTYNTLAVFLISKTEINLNEFRNNASDSTNSAKTRVYYR